MESVDIADAKKNLEDLVARAAKGEEICILQHGVVAARLSAAHPVTEWDTRRIPGRWKNRLVVADAALLAPLSSAELTTWYGEAG